MRKVFVIARREYLAHVATKAFIISLVLVPILAIGGIVVQKLIKDRSETGEKTMIVIDGTAELLPLLQAAAAEYNVRDTIDNFVLKAVANNAYNAWFSNSSLDPAVLPDS